MTNADDPSQDHDDAPPESSPDGADLQSLTDLIDQLDRAAFRRALANRDAQRNDVRERKVRSQ